MGSGERAYNPFEGEVVMTEGVQGSSIEKEV